MTNSEISSNRRSTPVPKWLIPVFAAISTAGFLDAAYLSAKHYLGTPVTCSVSLFDGCEKVTTSAYATIGGIPLAMFGAIYYLIIFILAVAYFDTKKDALLRFTARFTFVGFIASVWFVYLQLFVIKALCIYCMISALASTILFAAGIYTLKKLKRA